MRLVNRLRIDCRQRVANFRFQIYVDSFLNTENYILRGLPVYFSLKWLSFSLLCSLQRSKKDPDINRGLDRQVISKYLLRGIKGD